MRKRKAEADHAARLVQECEAMETEIAMLKNKRSPTEVSQPRTQSISYTDWERGVVLAAYDS